MGDIWHKICDDEIARLKRENERLRDQLECAAADRGNLVKANEDLHERMRALETENGRLRADQDAGRKGT